MVLSLQSDCVAMVLYMKESRPSVVDPTTPDQPNITVMHVVGSSNPRSTLNLFSNHRLRQLESHTYSPVPGSPSSALVRTRHSPGGDL
ncbi:hypothetical protein L6452_06083 [Arctium lappa]|uniref:Uncharacterized protein n=1 Tax=Arctium lappa TaxID=4217 RepID=A0ACB9EIU6_ARCLA|nr:hypothetical protein L6452_06083 [Arctium lappa]